MQNWQLRPDAATALLPPLPAPGRVVQRGEPLCEVIHPLEGRVLAQVPAPVDGRVFFAHHSPLVYERGVVYKIITE